MSTFGDIITFGENCLKNTLDDDMSTSGDVSTLVDDDSSTFCDVSNLMKI